MRVWSMTLIFLLATSNANALTIKSGQQEPLSRDEVVAYLEVRTQSARLMAELRHDVIDMDEYIESRRQLLSAHGWTETVYRLKQDRIFVALEMMRRYGLLQARDEERSQYMTTIMENGFLSKLQKQRILQTIRLAYDAELERIAETRQDWPAVAPFADSLDALQASPRIPRFLAG